MVRFDLSIVLEYNVSASTDFVFAVQPAKTSQQQVRWERLETWPDLPARSESNGIPATRHLRIHMEPGPFTLRYDCVVDVEHYFALPADIAEVPLAHLPSRILQYIYPSRYCPSDRFLEIARREFGSMEMGYARVDAISKWVKERTRFKPGTSHSGTSALDTYDSCEGVCRDFAHLMITMCRALNIPARLATGIDYGADPALGPTDFHCYVEVFLGDRWYIFDPSGISPRTGLIRIATGRDASDVAFATIFGSVLWKMPTITVSAEGMPTPMRHDYAVSTDDGVEGDEVWTPSEEGLRSQAPQGLRVDN